ncbi:MAG: LA2681 family HEPN domain-containing protein [Caldilineaceae bacterium]|nr:LA2681 family HEPN domain-containing protein [Caldilineaceae bacterium]
MTTLESLAQAIDNASDAGDEKQLRQLSLECEQRIETAEGEDRVHLLYYRANTYAGIISSRQHDDSYKWDWEQLDGVQNILLLRRAIKEPAFKSVNPVYQCQIRTNLASRLNDLGRPLAANEQWLETLATIPRFAKALAGRAKAISFYTSFLYDTGHQACLLDAAKSMFDDALQDGIWESGDRATYESDLTKEREQIEAYLIQVAYDGSFDLNQWSLGRSKAERSYRHWCLSQRLFINPLNDIYTESIAATDVLHLPDHTYEIAETPRFPAYFNLLKQEYVSARYRLYRATHEDDPGFLMRDVRMLDSGENQVLGHYVEELRSAFGSAYAIFDKIGLFLNDYYRIGLDPKKVSFRRVWFEKKDQLRPIFRDHPNWSLRGLYFLSKDLFDESFSDVAEPDANDLAQLRHQLEHRFVSFQQIQNGANTETHRLMQIDDFEKKTLRLLRMVREALIYLSLAMHREEFLRKQETKDKGGITGVFAPWPIEAFRRL